MEARNVKGFDSLTYRGRETKSLVNRLISRIGAIFRDIRDSGITHLGALFSGTPTCIRTPDPLQSRGQCHR